MHILLWFVAIWIHFCTLFWWDLITALWTNTAIRVYLWWNPCSECPLSGKCLYGDISFARFGIPRFPVCPLSGNPRNSLNFKLKPFCMCEHSLSVGLRVQLHRGVGGGLGRKGGVCFSVTDGLMVQIVHPPEFECLVYSLPFPSLSLVFCWVSLWQQFHWVMLHLFLKFYSSESLYTTR